MATTKLKIYLDNDMVSELMWREFPLETDALDRLQDSEARGEVKLCTSEVTLIELSEYKNDNKRRDIEAEYKRLSKVTFLDDHRVLGFHSQSDHRGGMISYPLVEDDPMSRELQEMGLGRKDAHHLKLAIESGCQVFLTCDGGILHRRSKLEERFGLRCRRPSELIGELTLYAYIAGATVPPLFAPVAVAIETDEVEKTI